MKFVFTTHSAAAAIVVASVGGCAQRGASGPYQPVSEAQRDSRLAQELSTQAAKLLRTDPDRAERLLRDALTEDLYFGPAHNNLGVLYLAQGRLFEAAGEFEWARKLMPGHPDPRMNLALTLERGGKTDEAIATYRSALDVYPGYVPAMQALAMLQVRSGRTDDTTPGLVSEIALRGETDEWRDWGRSQSLRAESR